MAARGESGRAQTSSFDIARKVHTGYNTIFSTGDRWRSDGASVQSRPDPSQCGAKSRGMGYWQDAEPRVRVETRPLYGSVSVSLRKAQLDRIDAGCRRAPAL